MSSERTKFARGVTYSELSKFRDKWLADSQLQDYRSHHSNLSITGALLYRTGLYHTFNIPISPSAWLVVQALQECGAAVKLNEKQSQQTRVEDFTRDGRFFETDTVRLRPGWKFLSPVVMRGSNEQVSNSEAEFILLYQRFIPQRRSICHDLRANHQLVSVKARIRLLGEADTLNERG